MNLLNLLGSIPGIGTVVGLGRLVAAAASKIYSPTQHKINEIAKGLANRKISEQSARQQLDRLYQKKFANYEAFRQENFETVVQYAADKLFEIQDFQLDKQYARIRTGLNELIPFWGTVAHLVGKIYERNKRSCFEAKARLIQVSEKYERDLVEIGKDTDRKFQQFNSGQIEVQPEETRPWSEINQTFNQIFPKRQQG